MIRADERFSYWREVVCHSVLNVSIETKPEKFSARITGRNFGDLRFVKFDCTGHELVRTTQQVERMPEDYYVFTLHRGGTSRFSQNGRTISLETNEIAIVDAQSPFRIVYPENASRSAVVIPRAMIGRRAPWLRSGNYRKIAADSPFADLARRHILELTAPDSTLSDNATSLLTDNLCNLIALASAPDIAPGKLQPELQLEALLAYCRQNLHDTDLSPKRVADHFGISLRTLHLRFKKLVQTFGHWVLDSRLDACRAALRDENQKALNISEIAYRWGFNDLSYFNKAFRARFERTPREWRNEGVN